MDPNAIAPFVMPWLIRYLPDLFSLAKTYGEKTIDTIAEKALEKVGENVTDETWKFGKPLLKKLLPKLAAKPAALEAVEDLAKSPDRSDFQTVMQVQLTKLLEADQDLLAEVQRIIAESQQAGGAINITASGERSVAGQSLNAPVFTGDIKVER